jgi:hypothetical protein
VNAQWPFAAADLLQDQPGEWRLSENTTGPQPNTGAEVTITVFGCQGQTDTLTIPVTNLP